MFTGIDYLGSADDFSNTYTYLSRLFFKQRGHKLSRKGISNNQMEPEI